LREARIIGRRGAGQAASLGYINLAAGRKCMNIDIVTARLATAISIVCTVTDAHEQDMGDRRMVGFHVGPQQEAVARRMIRTPRA
jgi:hypothetical protein